MAIVDPYELCLGPPVSAARCACISGNVDPGLARVLCSGLSYRRFASLDVYVAIYTSVMGMHPQPMAVWNAAYHDSPMTLHGIVEHSTYLFGLLVRLGLIFLCV